MWRRVLAYALFGVGFLIAVYFRVYKGYLIPNPFWFWLVGLTVFLVGFFLLRYMPNKMQSEKRVQLAKAIADLKINGDRIPVDLAGCEIKENNYSEEITRDPGLEALVFDWEGQIGGLNALTRDRSIKKEQSVVQSVLVFKYNNLKAGNTETFVSPVIPKDRVTLSFYLEQQKQTVLYVDKGNRKRYYLDVEFLNSN